MRALKFVLWSAGLILFAGSASAMDTLFYKGYNYGTQACYNPLWMTLNGSFDIMQITNRNNDLSKLRFAEGSHNVWWNVTHARAAVSAYGTKRFLENEISPATFKIGNAQYWPNYQLHLLGSGMTFVATAEWYAWHRFPYPRTMSLLTMAAQHWINEAVENGGFKGYNVDPLTDLLVFDPLGIVLFSIHGVPEFFAHRLNMTDWSFQPIVVANHTRLVNNGQKFVYKWRLPGSADWSLFYMTGIEGLIGLSRRVHETDCFTVGLGLSANKLEDVEDPSRGRKLATDLIYTGGLFYDRNNSLLASLIVGGPRGYIARANVYPGIVNPKGLSPGLVLMLQEDHTVTFGVAVKFIPAGVGVGKRV